MSSGSSPPGGFRESLKRRAHRVKDWLRPEDQVFAPRTPSPQPQVGPSSGVPPPRTTVAYRPQPQPPAQTQSYAPLPPPVPRVGGTSFATNLGAAATVQPTNRPTNPESRLANIAKQAGADAWTGLKATLQLVEKSSDVFPPLKSAVGGFLGVVNIFETAAQNRKDYADLALNIRGLLDDFTQNPEEDTSSRISEALRAMARGLEREMGHVMEQRQRSGFRSHLEAARSVSDVQECYRRVEVLCRELQNRAVLRTWNVVEEQQVEARLRMLDAALKAMYNSKLSTVVGRRACTPGTREAILAGMREWADDPAAPKVYWMNGMAGTGKTTLAYSFCAEMQRSGRSGATFFCSRTDADSRDASRIVPTIAYQLARLLPSYREAVIRQIGEDKDICAREIGVQFEKLIRDPLQEVEAWVPKGMVVTIDALDECDGRDRVQDVLNVLFLHAGNLPIKFLVTSRPEPGLLEVLESRDNHHRTVFHLHDVEASFVQADIRTYLQAELGAITLSQTKLGQLALQAGALFIYAATAVRYIHPKGRRVNFHQRLDDLLSIAPQAGSDTHRGIDSLYTAVLTTSLKNEELGVREKAHIRLVLDTAICARVPMGMTAMAKLLELDEKDVVCALQHLRSVLHVSQDDGLISTLHASFPDFMINSARSKEMYCNMAKHHHQLSLCCFSTMERELRFNICELESSFDFDENVPNLDRKIEEAISPELFYACSYWPDHLVSGEAQDDVRTALESFLSNRLLFWMEVLNLKQCIHIGARGLYRVRAWAQSIGCMVSVQQLAQDVAGFVTMFSSNAVSRSTPHIYISAVPFWPEGRPVTKHYAGRIKGAPKVGGTGMERREAVLLAVLATTSFVYCVACVSDGARIVSGSRDGMIQIWDAHTGKQIGESLKGHTNTVRSVEYSPDGIHIVSGSDDGTIRVWDAYTGKQIGDPLQGHIGAVWSVGYSSDGARIVSGSYDTTIRIWDAQTGRPIGKPLEGHTYTVRSVGYSPDGACIVSGSDDGTIRIWDAHTGKQIGDPLEGHMDSVRSVVYSSDSAHIVSGSDDWTIRMWDAHTGKQIGEPLQGHTNVVNSVGYSSDGAHIVSGSHDNTIRLWDAHTGKQIGDPLQGHSGWVWSVKYSPDGARIVSGSEDRTIRIWDAHSDKQTAELLQGHTGWVCSVKYSPDARQIVSGSDDGTIRIWDAYTSKQLQGHAGAVTSVSYSSDGARIVSGSRDGTIQMWDARTGKQIGGVLQGHSDGVLSVRFSSDDSRIVSGSLDKTIQVWDAHTGEMIGEPLIGHAGVVWSVGYSPDGRYIVSGSSDNTIRLWDAHTGGQIGESLMGHTGAVMSVGHSPDGTCIVSGAFDTLIRIWDMYTGKPIGDPLEGHTGWVTSVVYSSDGSRIISGSYDKTIRIWDAHSGKQIGKPLRGHTGAVLSVGYSPDGTHIVSGSSDNTIRLWDAQNGEPLQGHTDSISLVAHSSNNSYMDSGLHDKIVRMQDLGPLSQDPCSTWTLEHDGYMVADGSKILMWVPSDVRTSLMSPQSTAVISRHGSVRVDFTHARIGAFWSQCYCSS